MERVKPSLCKHLVFSRVNTSDKVVIIYAYFYLPRKSMQISNINTIFLFHLHKRNGKLSMVTLACSDEKRPVSTTKVVKNASCLSPRETAMKPSVRKRRAIE